MYNLVDEPYLEDGGVDDDFVSNRARNYRIASSFRSDFVVEAWRHGRGTSAPVIFILADDLLSEQVMVRRDLFIARQPFVEHVWNSDHTGLILHLTYGLERGADRVWFPGIHAALEAGVSSRRAAISANPHRAALEAAPSAPSVQKTEQLHGDVSAGPRRRPVRSFLEGLLAAFSIAPRVDRPSISSGDYDKLTAHMDAIDRGQEYDDGSRRDGS